MSRLALHTTQVLSHSLDHRTLDNSLFLLLLDLVSPLALAFSLCLPLISPKTRLTTAATCLVPNTPSSAQDTHILPHHGDNPAPDSRSRSRARAAVPSSDGRRRHIRIRPRVKRGELTCLLPASAKSHPPEASTCICSGEKKTN